jgi:hypothetical protein
MMCSPSNKIVHFELLQVQYGFWYTVIHQKLISTQ